MYNKNNDEQRNTASKTTKEPKHKSCLGRPAIKLLGGGGGGSINLIMLLAGTGHILFLGPSGSNL